MNPGFVRGEVAERSNAAVLKTVAMPFGRGSESRLDAHRTSSASYGDAPDMADG